MIQPMCYVIAHETSKTFNDCAFSLKKYGWQFEKFPAVDGWKTTDDDWKKINVFISEGGKIKNQPGTQGCFLSHFSLWSICHNNKQPIIVMEHDALVTAPWPQDLDINLKVIKLHSATKIKFNPVYGTWSHHSHAYTLTPEQAGLLITHAQKNGAQASDKHIGDLVLPWSFLGWDLVKLNPNKGISTTKKKTWA